jgi:hypothetical protein
MILKICRIIVIDYPMKRLIPIILLVIWFSSCGIYSFTGASLSPEIKTVSVKSFTNQASLVVPSLTQVLTEKLKDKFIKEMNLSMVEDNGDINFRGVITDYKTQPSSITTNDKTATTRLTISVRVKFENIKEPKQNYENSFSAYMDFDSNKNLASIEDELINEICDMLVQDIFNKAVNNW